MSGLDKKVTYELTFQDVIKVLQLVDECSYKELHLEVEDLKLNVVFDQTVASNYVAAEEVPLSLRSSAVNEAATVGSAHDLAPAVMSTRKDSVDTGAGSKETSRVDHGIPVYAPMSGIYYRASAPGEPPYVEVGSVVNEGDTVGLIEVMKLFTPIKSPAAGRVVEIQVNNEQVVTSDQVLMVIEPA